MDPRIRIHTKMTFVQVVSMEKDGEPSPIMATFLKMATSTDYKMAGLYSIGHNDLCSGGLIGDREGWGTKSHHGNISQNGHLHRLQNCRIAQNWTECKQ